jgi:hypothetical protein
MSWDAVWDVLKWVLAALAAGFIGQFGRVLAMRIIQRRRAARMESDDIPSDRDPAPRPREEPSTSPEVRAQLKIEKKRAKAEVKRAKKASDGEEEKRDKKREKD